MIDLARCDDFELGSATIRPASREIVSGGRVESIEPKVMQLLVTLARLTGRVVSRDELVEQCWGGRVVGEDAINRVIGKLRRAAESVAGGTFRIETIARVGVRLMVIQPATTPPLPGADAALLTTPRAFLRRWAFAAVLGTGVAAIGLGVAFHTAIPRQPSPRAMPTLPAAVTDLETRGLSAMFENTPEQTAEGVAYLRQATALAPQAAPVWGSLAMSYVLSLGWSPPAARAAVSARVRDAATHALAIDPRESRSAAALVSLAPTFRHWQQKSQALARAALTARQDRGPLLYQQLQFLLAVGRTRDALAQAERLAVSSPLIPWIQAARIDLLAAAGRLDDADRAAEDARAIWPRDRLIWFTRFDLAVFNGQPERALAMAEDRLNWPKQTTADEMSLAARTAEAIIGRGPAEIDAALLAYRSAVGRGQGHAERAMRVAAALGRPATALEFARLLYSGGLAAEPRGTMLPQIGLADDAERPTAALFLPPAQALWSQPEFFALMSDIGLIHYWRQAAPPDICLSAGGRQLCRPRQVGP